MASLLYGSGLRLMECLRLRVKDIDFEAKQVIVRDGKEFKYRITTMPEKIIPALSAHLARIKALHDSFLRRGYGTAELPYALFRKYPNAAHGYISKMIQTSSKKCQRSYSLSSTSIIMEQHKYQ